MIQSDYFIHMTCCVSCKIRYSRLNQDLNQDFKYSQVHKKNILKVMGSYVLLFRASHRTIALLAIWLNKIGNDLPKEIQDLFGRHLCLQKC